jgi:hypothetical protein
VGLRPAEEELKGLASAAEVAAALADLRAFAATPGTLVGDPRTFQVWARR